MPGIDHHKRITLGDKKNRSKIMQQLGTTGQGRSSTTTEKECLKGERWR